MHIPARYYKRIPTFYFVVGILLVISSFNMDHNPLAAYLYFMAGVVSVIYAVSVFQARRKRRKYLPPQGPGTTIGEEAPIEENQPPPATKPPEFINDNPSAVQNASATDEDEAAAAQTPESATEDGDLSQHGSGVASPAQPEAKQ